LKKLKKYLYILLAFLLTSVTSFSQEVILSQQFAASQYQNPAGVGGSEYDNRFQALSKSQMIDGNNLYKTYLISYDTRLKNDLEGSKNYLGIGGQIISDQVMSGIMQNNYLTLNLAYHIFLDERLNSDISLGIGVTGASTYLDKTRLRFSDQYDYRALLTTSTLENLVPYPLSFTANAGAMYTRHNENNFLQAGFMTYLYAKPNVTYTPMNQAEKLRFKAFVNTEFPFVNDNSLLLYVNYLNRGSISQFYCGALIGLPIIRDEDYLFKMYAGCFYRQGEAYVPSVSFISRKSTFGVSYDVYNNTIPGADLRQSGFELSYSRKFGQLRKNRFRTIFD
jgi:type IX secretion system PorP/SprF family membrane protein